MRHSQGVSGLFTDHFEFLVCLSVCQLAYILTKIRPIQVYLLYWMRYLSEIFGGFPGIFLYQIQIIWNFSYVCPSVSWITSILIQANIEIYQILDEISFKCFFWTHSFDACTLLSNHYEFIVCPSVCQLAYFLTESISIQIYLQFSIRYLSEIL